MNLQTIARLYGVRCGLKGHNWPLKRGGTNTGVVSYDAIVPRSESQAREIGERLLGPLRQADASEQAIINTLCAYLDENRTWNAASARLGIYRQTLGYRIGRIEQLMGRNCKSSKDLDELWVARIALNRSSPGAH